MNAGPINVPRGPWQIFSVRPQLHPHRFKNIWIQREIELSNNCFQFYPRITATSQLRYLHQNFRIIIRYFKTCLNESFIFCSFGTWATWISCDDLLDIITNTNTFSVSNNKHNKRHELNKSMFNCSFQSCCRQTMLHLEQRLRPAIHHFNW